MKKKRSLLDGQWTLDTFATTCACGIEVYLLRRGKLVLIPTGHKCQYADFQQLEKRTIRAMETVSRVLPEEARKRLDDARRSCGGGMERPDCKHESVFTTDGKGAYCLFCGETLE